MRPCNWELLLYLLERKGCREDGEVGFMCISSVWFSVRVDGVLHSFFDRLGELRQGDSLSHLLFILVLE